MCVFFSCIFRFELVKKKIQKTHRYTHADRHRFFGPVGGIHRRSSAEHCRKIRVVVLILLTGHPHMHTSRTHARRKRLKIQGEKFVI